jgi:MBG domain-containing protein/Kelch motif protein/galactose oxidase-like protein
MFLCRFFVSAFGRGLRTTPHISFLEEGMKTEAYLSAARMSRVSKRCFVAAVIVLLTGVLFGAIGQAQILGSGQLNSARRGHTATVLQDGKILIVGGDNQNGIVGQAEIFNPATKTSSSGPSLATARTDHTATALTDGRVLVIGGRDQNGPLTSSEIYDPMTGSFTSGPMMTMPRSGHTATTLSNGNILVAGGDAAGSAEIYNPATQSFSPIAANMATARKFHSAILTSSGQVLLIGGINAQNAVLNTAEVYDPASQSFYLPPTDLQTPRAFATLKLLPDGKVQIIGGDSDFSMEIFDPQDGKFNGVAYLPPTPDLLGATLGTRSRAALVSPYASLNPNLLSTTLTPEQLALLDRADHTITELTAQNQALVAGGINSAGQVLNSATLVSSSPASVTTDKTDYAPGTIVTITGKGFQPNEDVAMALHERPDAYPDFAFTATADNQGNFIFMQFAPQSIDVGRTFTLTAIGQSSGFTAQTAFTDARNLNLTFAGTGSGSVTIKPSTGTVNAPISCGGTGTSAISQTVTSTCLPNITTSDNGASVTFSASALSGSTFAGWSGQSNLSSSTCSGTTNPCSAVLGANPALTVTFTAAANTNVTVSTASATYGDASVTVSATINSTSTVNVGTVTFTVKQGATTIGSPTTSGTVTSGSASVSYALPAGTNAGSYSIEAVYSGGTGFNGSSGSGTLNISKRNATWTTSPASKTYGDPDPVPLTTGSGSGFVDAVTATYSRVAGETVAGSPYHITAALSAAAGVLDNYNITNNGADFTINKRNATWTTSPASKTYGDPDPVPLTTGSGSGFVDAVTATYSRVAGETVGTYTTSATLSPVGVLGNYNITYNTALFTINKRPASVTPNAASKIYGDADPVLNGTLSGFLTGDNVTASYSRTAGEMVGTYTISATLSAPNVLVLGNYDITYNTAKFTITYGVCLLFDNSKAVQKNATIPIKLNLCDVNKVNLSSSAVVLTATNLVWSGTETAPEVQDSGNANPDDNFRFTGGSYMFNLSTKNLWSGKWGLEFKANGDSLPHVVTFNVK